ncbi:DeoR/GlpR family DNA-binding transcription regulator [Verminephrobacter aporrectodeae]|uniref:DeoR/GlpR family DNA-binding transcription regulator n=1 Tax=Verminephrobacter aporrectodeae TaxID=1110389 RepID=UPI0022443F33|nr:DeoR/GlpR family DNA-binding transcription regulator [Verminephrobacter aporrectodeae]MCW8176880.1 DeoR/GlpR transcriptional regulator [Verminephrobacter aporrectodeae subsp. tuberculatae]MCW8203407.1 DeoR/GlpR transcriptional regulator [Verminephrobacter aporrectodeae subsp. tuberculatae]
MTPLTPTRSLMETISAEQGNISTAFKRISRYLLQAPADFMHKSIQEIAAAAQVSEPTVLRYSRHFGYKGIPEFRIALAMSLVNRAKAPAEGPLFVEPNLADKAVVNRDLKHAIGKAALPLLEQDRSIILDSGSTTAIFARQLREVAGRTILTTGLNVVEALWGATQHTLILPAGTLRVESKSLSGRMVETTLQNMRFDTGYFGADSIDPDAGLSTFNEAEAHQGAAMMGACTRVVVLADSSKFTSPALHRICVLDRIHTIVTDTGLPLDIANALSARGTRVIRADPASTPA